MNTIKTRREIAQTIALDYYDGDALALIADAQAAGSSKHFVEGGGLAVYYFDQRKELQKIYGQTDDEADKFSDSQVWDKYIAVMSDTISRIRLAQMKTTGGRYDR